MQWAARWAGSAAGERGWELAVATHVRHGSASMAAGFSVSATVLSAARACSLRQALRRQRLRRSLPAVPMLLSAIAAGVHK